MNRPSYKELLFYEREDREEQLRWIKDAVNGSAKFYREPPYSYEEELAREIMQLHTRIAELEEQVWDLNLANEKLESAYFADETIAPDGTLKPSARKLLERLEKAETDYDIAKSHVTALLNRIAELEAFIDQLIEIGEWGVTGMVIATSFSVGKIHDLAERRQNEWLTLVKDWKEREDSE